MIRSSTARASIGRRCRASDAIEDVVGVLPATTQTARHPGASTSRKGMDPRKGELLDTGNAPVPRPCLRRFVRVAARFRPEERGKLRGTPGLEHEPCEQPSQHGGPEVHDLSLATARRAPLRKATRFKILPAAIRVQKVPVEFILTATPGYTFRHNISVSHLCRDYFSALPARLLNSQAVKGVKAKAHEPMREIPVMKHPAVLLRE